MGGQKRRKNKQGEGTGRRFTDEDKAKVVRAYLAGDITLRQAAAVIGTTAVSAGKWIKSRRLRALAKQSMQ